MRSSGLWAGLLVGCQSSLFEPDETGSLPDVEPHESGDDSGEPTLALIPDGWILDLDIHQNATAVTILDLTWQQTEETEAIWVEFRFEGEDWRSSRVREGTIGDHQDWVLGVPGGTEVELRLATLHDGETLYGPSFSASTGIVPLDLARPELQVAATEAAHPAPFILGSVDMGSSWYSGPWWLYIVDRQGRIVWYHEVPDGNCTMFPRVAQDGSHIVFDRTSNYSHYDNGDTSTLQRMTLHGEWSETLAIPGLGYTFSETDEGSIIHDYRGADRRVNLAETSTDGNTRIIWSCDADRFGYCLANTANWIPDTNRILFSMYQNATVLEIDRDTGEIHGQYGQTDGSYAFDDPSHGFDMQHFPTYTTDGTLLVHTHVPTQPELQRAYEYRVDHDTRELNLVWSFGEGYLDYATYSGEAVRLDNGNTLINYGTDGSAREIDAEGNVVWEMAFPARYLVGHTELVDDLYDLVEGPE